MLNMSGRNWKENEIAEMLSIVKEKNIMTLTDGKKYRSIEIYRSVANELKKKNIIRSSDQIITKLKNLRSMYVNVMKYNKTSGAAAMECTHFQYLDEIFDNRPLVTCLEGGVNSCFELSNDLFNEEPLNPGPEVTEDNARAKVASTDPKKKKYISKTEKVLKDQRQWMETEFAKQREFEKSMMKSFQKNLQKTFISLIQAIQPGQLQDSSSNVNLSSSSSNTTDINSDDEVLFSFDESSCSTPNSSVTNFFANFDPENE